MLTIALYFLSQTIASSASYTFYPGRRTLRELQKSSPNHKAPCHKIKDMDDKISQSTVKDVSTAVKYATSNDSFDEIVYHIDYHGVTTHPTPTPKHPKP
ncbi:Solute carrier family 13 member 3 [Melia azedarach]|uniref:Solute carrier family 13 member 3 n=1 Tax=Melia azedarach TaxID=155640 RepID=A0ACC1XEK7_MELAZ|nr:Solute carrier family 13 member 3 [Melia azedarach]